MASDAPAAPPAERSRYAVTRAVFLRGLGVVYLAAFASYWVQMDGLVGSRGILPATRLLDAVQSQVGDGRWLAFPTLCWFGASDAWLHAFCGVGVAVSCVLVVGVAPIPCLAALWALYLSLVKAGGEFYWFQWDSLLLETGLCALFFAPLTLRARLAASGDPPRVALWLLRWILFRLMFESGVVKLNAGDKCWCLDDLTALTYHYWTQPLPPWTAWYVDRLPTWFHQASAAAMYAMELIAPFTMFLPRRFRLSGAAALVGLQVVLLATGNFGFFNLLSLVLCIPLLDDAAWPARWRRTAPLSSAVVPASRRWTRWSAVPFAVVVVAVTSAQLCDALNVFPGWRRAVAPVERRIAPFESVNSYGLFRVMTKERHEIVIEGSADEKTWRAYEFRFKPGDVTRRPAFTTPHMPRLDWQMWFAALGDAEQSPWLSDLLDRLLDGSPPVLSLFASNPFPDAPPRYVRALVYDYRFADAAEHARTGAWWRRELLGTYVETRSK